MYSLCVLVSWVLVCCWCARVQADCDLPHFSLDISYTGSWDHKINVTQQQERPWNLSIYNTTSLQNGDRTFLITVQLAAPALGQDCQTEAPKKYYKIYTNMSWSDALEACAKENAHLAVIDSEQEAEDVLEIITKEQTMRWVHWIGFHDYFKEGDYTTIFNEKLGYRRWGPGEPSGTTALNCGFIYFTNATNYGLADGNCKNRYRYICERENPALGYQSASREKNLTPIQENNLSVSQENNPSGDQQKNLNASQLNQSVNEQKNPTASLGNNPSVSQENNPPGDQEKNSNENQLNQSENPPEDQDKKLKDSQLNQSVNEQKNQSASQGNNQSVNKHKNPSANGEKTPSANQEQNESANEEENPTASWKRNPISGYIYVPQLGHYKLHDLLERRTWHEAHVTCAREGSHLLIMNSEKEERVTNILIEVSHTRGRLHWIGFHDQYNERKYISVCNDTLEYTKWYPGRPDGSKQLNCGYYLYHNATHNGMADGDCSWSGPFICEDESVEKRPPLPQSGYRKAPGNLGYYKKYSELKTFQEANNICENDGSHLIIINNDLEERVMMTIAGKGSHWVGIHDRFSEGKFVTVYNDTLKSTGYTRWYPGEPYNVEWIEEDCIVYAYHSKSRRGLADLTCDERLPFVCEFDLNKCPRKS